jgi:hypothetical protein
MVLKLLSQPYPDLNPGHCVNLLVGNTEKNGVEWYSNLIKFESKIKRIKCYFSSVPFLGFKIKNNLVWIVGSRYK